MKDICTSLVISFVLAFAGITTSSPALSGTPEAGINIPDQGQALQMTQAGAYQFSFRSIEGQPMPLRSFAGKVILIVNTASQCGFTKQYKDLQDLYDRYNDRGLVVIGVPCNDFGGQEPGTESEIKDFAKNNFGVTFPLTSKVSVGGDDAHPFFKWAADQKKGGILQSGPKWNFHKFLIDRRGHLVKSYGSHINPLDVDITSEIEILLTQSP